MTRCNNCGTPIPDGKEFCSHKCGSDYWHKSEKERLFCDWLCVEEIDYSRKMGGEQMQLRKTYNEWLIENGYGFHLRINPGYWIKPSAKYETRSTYYTAKINAIQAEGLEAYDAMEVYNAVCNMVGVTNSLRSAS